MAPLKGTAGSPLPIEPPGGDDANRRIVIAVRVVVDRLERGAVGGHAGDEPLCAPVVRFALGVMLADRLLDVGRIEPALRRVWPVSSSSGPPVTPEV
ncbi:MAG: hypothetical protein J0H06_01235, partial [Actinobacteria bacterium]|nr:hypothetical protein [Actinomycetota bacterium]